MCQQLQNYSITELSEAYYYENRQFFKTKPVDMSTFLADGAFLSSAFPAGFRPFWKEHLLKIHPSPFMSSALEVLCLLPIGSGKTTAATVSLLYDFHVILCMKDPVSFLGLGMRGTKIVYMLFSSTKQLAGDMNVSIFFELLNASSWFRDMGVNPKITSFKSHPTVELTNEVNLTIGSTEKHALGMAVLSGYLDEASFQSTVSNQAHKTYSAIMRRRESRFMQAGGFLPGIFWVASSPNLSSDFVDVQIKKAKKAGVETVSYVINDLPIWEIRKNEGLYEGPTFPVFIGSDTHDPKLLLPEEQTAFEKHGPVYNVPYELRGAFEKDLLSAIRDHAGVSLVKASRLFWSVEAVQQQMVVPFRFTKQILQFDFFESAKSGTRGIREHVLDRYFEQIDDPEWQRYIHIDVGLTGDRLGIAATYATNRDRRFRGDTFETRQERIFRVDFALGVEAMESQQIPFHVITDFFYYLRDVNYPIAFISADGYQSAQLLQELRLLGYETGVVSVDRKRDPYLGVKECVLSQVLELPVYELLRTEIMGLEDNGIKIDHSQTTSKDVSDGVAGSLFTCREKEQTAVSTATQYYKNQQQQTRNSLIEQELKKQARSLLLNQLF